MATEIEKLKKKVSLLRIVSESVGRLERRGNEYWSRCPFHEEKTASFAIKVKEGTEVYFCQGCKAGGDIITWFEKHDHLSKKDAIEKLKELTFDPSAEATLAKNQADADRYRRVAGAFKSIVDSVDDGPKVEKDIEKWPSFEKALLDSHEALVWLNDIRGISTQTAVDLRLGFVQTMKGHLSQEEEFARSRGWILFPRFDDDCKHVIACKMRSIATKAFSQWPGMDPTALFNAGPRTMNDFDDLFVTEGEMDACIMEQAGFNAVSIPSASAKVTPEMKVILKRAKRVFCVGDTDTQGTEAMVNLQHELGNNSFMIEWPGVKDANEFFCTSCERNVDKFREEVNALVKCVLQKPIEEFTSLLERLHVAGRTGTNFAGDPFRLHFPFSALDNMSYVVPGSVVVIYSTYTGTGKSVFVTQLMLFEADRGETVVVYSPEVRDEAYLALVAAQTLGPLREGGLNRASAISGEDYQETRRLLDVPTKRGGDFQYYVGHDLPMKEGESPLDFIETVIMATGATRFVIDTFDCLVVPQGREGTFEAQARTINALDKLAGKHHLIFVVVGQSNKEADDLKEKRRDAKGVLSGSRQVQNKGDSVYLVHRKQTNIPEDAPLGKYVDLLERETTVELIKGRLQGPTGKYTKLIYKKEHSRFYPLQPGDPPPGMPIEGNGEE